MFYINTDSIGVNTMATILRHATAGTLESSDAFVTLEPNENGLIIDIDSVVQKQFGEVIRQTVCEVLDELALPMQR